MPDEKRITMFDRVRVRAASDTESRGLAGLLGDVHGETTPSKTGVEVVGQLASDYAIAVMFQGRPEAIWFAPELLEFVDHAPGTEIQIGKVAKKWVRREDGNWDERSLAPSIWNRLFGWLRRR